MSTPRFEDAEAVGQALAKLLAIADRLDARNMQTMQRIEAAIVALDKGVSRLDNGGEKFAKSALQVIGNNAQQTIAEDAGQAMGAFRQQLQQSANTAQSAAQAMDDQRKGLTTARRTLVWNGLIALLVGSLLAAGGAAWIARDSMQKIRQAHFGQDILQATQSGAITRCGNSLCTKVGNTPQRYGARGEYLLLEE
jgi:hypothetical protein